MVIRSAQRNHATIPMLTMNTGTLTRTNITTGFPLAMTPFQMACKVIAQTRPIGVIQTQAAGERRLADMPMANPVQAVKVT